MNRRKFISNTGTITAGSMLVNPASFASVPSAKMRVAIVGTGVRGISMWGKSVVKSFSDQVEFVGLCDINPGRLAYAKQFMEVTCPVFTNFDEMMKKTAPEYVIVTTKDSNHHEFIIKALQMGANVITEKPMTTDEQKCQAILDAEKSSGKKITVTFNYRYSPYFTKIKELLRSGRIGKITSVDFHWYLNTYHGAAYFRRWHGNRANSGTLLVHKSSHHFDLVNWWLDSEPEQVFAYGALEHYGKNNPFRGKNCRVCEHKEQCGKYYFDITKDEHLMKLYVENEKYDGYIRDNCIWREDIDIYDKMAVTARYANGTTLSYSLTTYSPYEGLRVAFNGTKGRIDAWEDIPWLKGVGGVDQATMHAAEMNQDTNDKKEEPIMLMENFGNYEVIKVEIPRGGHGGGDTRLKRQIFAEPNMPDPLKHVAGLRDGAMAILLGIAARKSIETNKPVNVGELTTLKPQAVRPA